MKLLIIFSFFLFMLSCQTNKIDNKTTFRHILPDSSIGRIANYELTFCKQSSELLNLPNIFNGVDSFEVRIWSFGFWTRSDLFVLRYTKNSWVASNYIYYGNSKTVDSLHLISRQVNDESAYKFSSYLCSDSILNLPSQIEIPNFNDNTVDGNTYYIEISTKKFYKILCYHNPQDFKDPANRQFLRLLDKVKESYKIYYQY